MEQQHVHPEPAEPHPLTVDHTEQSQRLALDAGLLLDLLDRDLGGRVADVGPSGGVQPDPRILALHEQQLVGVVAHDRSDRHLRRDVAGHAFADRLHPLLHEVVGLPCDLVLLVEFAGRGLDVAGDVEHLFEALTLVQALREAEPRASDRGERLAPSGKVAGARCHVRHATTHQATANRSARSISLRWNESVTSPPLAVRT